MNEAIQRLVDSGVAGDNISTEFICISGNTIQGMIQKAVSDNFGSVVVGRREAIGFVEAHFRGRFSKEFIKSIDNSAIWVVS